MQINLLQAMNYPLISEYVEAIKMAEDNFEELSYLRPVLDGTGQPVMSSGNFAVVFKMRDERDGKLYAVRCFHRDQEGREESYRLIEEELKDVESPYLVSFRYIDKELFVDSSQTDETEFPVLLMDWVEGITLDKYLRENLDDQYALEMLAYRFSLLAQWLIPQPFAHGDLKPDNILVREDGTLVLVDYDGMYVPAMKGQKARELGSPDFRHPLRTEDDFDEHIDDFPFVSVLLSLKAISLNPQLLEEYGATDRLLFSEKDYRDIANSAVLRCVLNQMANVEIARIYSLFIIVLSEKVISENSYRLVFAKEEKNKYFEIYKNQSRFDSESKYCYSCLLMNGWGCKQDINKGIDLIAELAEQGHAQAQFKLGRYYDKGEGVPQNYEKAIIWYTKAAEQGYVKALYNLGQSYRQGKGVPQNYEKTAEWITRAAEQGFAPAQTGLGFLYFNGLGVEQNHEKAVEWYTKAAEQGYASAQYNLGYCYTIGKGIEQNYEKAVEWLTKAAEQGHAPAQSALGSLYAKGLGVEQNYEKAIDWYTQAAEQGHAPAQFELGYLYMKGQGVPQNYEKAVEWYTKAAEQGNKYSQYHLANCYRFGKGVSVNLKETVRLFGLAADQGLEIAWKEIIKTRKGWRIRAAYSEDGETFEGIYAGTEYEIREGTKYISEGACFDMNWEIDCSYFSKLTIPKSIIHIGDYPFGSHMSEVVCYSPFYEVDNKTLYTKGKKELIQCFNHEAEEFEIPEGVEAIRKYAFYSCQFKRIVISSSVKEIGINPFVEAGVLGDDMHFNLEIVSNSPHCIVYKKTLYKNDKIISYWGNGDSLVIPYGIQIIEDDAFRRSNIKKIYLPNSIKCIGKDAFSWCEQLEKIIISYGELQRFKMLLPSTMHNMLCEEITPILNKPTEKISDDLPF